jgi:hypothetical protein
MFSWPVLFAGPARLLLRSRELPKYLQFENKMMSPWDTVVSVSRELIVLSLVGIRCVIS